MKRICKSEAPERSSEGLFCSALNGRKRKPVWRIKNRAYSFPDSPPVISAENGPPFLPQSGFCSGGMQKNTCSVSLLMVEWQNRSAHDPRGELPIGQGQVIVHGPLPLGGILVEHPLTFFAILLPRGSWRYSIAVPSGRLTPRSSPLEE